MHVMNRAHTRKPRDGPKRDAKKKSTQPHSTRGNNRQAGQMPNTARDAPTGQSCLETETRVQRGLAKEQRRNMRRPCGTHHRALAPRDSTTQRIASTEDNNSYLTTKSQIGDTSLPCFPALLCISSVQFLDLRLRQQLHHARLHSCFAAFAAALSVVDHSLPRVEEEPTHWADS